MNENLFSLEIRVENISRLKVSCTIPAISFRLLDFPTLILHYIPPANLQRLREKAQVQDLKKENVEAEFRDRYGNISFCKGKSCLFRANIERLQSQLQVTPLYVMLLNVWHKKPKLVASTMIPLKKAIDKIAVDVKRTGISVPTISQQEGLYDVYNLMGTIVGSVEISVRLLSLGGCLAPHISEKSIIKSINKREDKKSSGKANHDDVVFGDLEILDEELSTKDSPTTMENAETQTNEPNPLASKPVIQTKPLYMEDIVEPVIITNTVCPPPLYYHVMSHMENSAENSKKRSEKKKLNDYPSINPQDVDFVYYNPDLLQPDGSCGCKSVSVQTDYRDSLPIATDKISECAIINCKSLNEELPILTALLEELSFLRTRGKGAHLSTSRKPVKEVSSCQSREPRQRECYSKVIDKKLITESKTLKHKPSVLRPKRVKFKQTNLKYGTTKTQLMRLEMNQKKKQTSGRKASYETKAFPSEDPTRDKRKSSSDLTRTHTVFHGSVIAEQPTNELKEAQDFAGVECIRGSEFSNETNEPLRPDSVDSSSRCLSSPNSVEIFLPQMEGESDHDGSDVFDVTALDTEDRFAPHLTYNKYGHTGIQNIPENTNQKNDQSELTVGNIDMPITRKSSYQLGSPKESIDQSEVAVDSLNQLNPSKGDQSDSLKNSTDKSEAVKSIPVSPPSPQKIPDLTRRRSITSQTAKSRTSTALSMYSDDFEECPVWETPNASDDSSSSISGSYLSIDSKNSTDKRNDTYQPVKSYFSPLKNGKHSRKSSGSEQCSPSSLYQDEDSLSREFSDSEKRPKGKNLLQLPKPANEMGYTF